MSVPKEPQSKKALRLFMIAQVLSSIAMIGIVVALFINGAVGLWIALPAGASFIIVSWILSGVMIRDLAQWVKKTSTIESVTISDAEFNVVLAQGSTGLPRRVSLLLKDGASVVISTLDYCRVNPHSRRISYEVRYINMQPQYRNVEPDILFDSPPHVFM